MHASSGSYRFQLVHQEAQTAYGHNTLKTCSNAESQALTFLQSGFVNMVLAGRCPTTISPLFFGRLLIALAKRSGGIQPIVVGMTLRRLVSKCASSFGMSRLVPYFSPQQLGVGTPGGCEAAIHAARRYLQSINQQINQKYLKWPKW